MKRHPLAFSVAALLWFTASSASAAYLHGGKYIGPPDTVPPGEGGGPNTGGGGPGPDTGGGGPGPGTGGGGPLTGGGSGGPGLPGPGPIPGGAAVTGGTAGKKQRGTSTDQWEFWWETNKEPYLNLRDRLGLGATESGAAAFLQGHGAVHSADRSVRPNREEVMEQIVPLLRDMLKANDRDIVDSAVLAIGRSVAPEDAAEVLDDVVATLAHDQQSVKQASILALGLLGSPRAVPPLVAVLQDGSEGRRLTNERSSIQVMNRAMAAIALGYVGAEETIPLLVEEFDKAPDSQFDLKASIVLALGLFEHGRHSIVPFLMEQLRDEKANRQVRAQVPISLARLGQEAEVAVGELMRIVKSRKTDILLAESAIIALGELASPVSQEARKLLQDLTKDATNAQSRHLALIALARIAGRAAADRTVEAHADVVDGVERFLLRQLVRPEHQPDEPWAGLALGVLGFEYEEDSSRRSALMQKVLEAFVEETDPSKKSAFAISCGLLGVRGAGEHLHATMMETNDVNLKSYTAVALGMIRYGEARDDLRRMVTEERDPGLRLNAATALGLMGDVETVPLLVDALVDARVLYVTSSAAKALGRVGDRRAVAPLKELVTDESRPALGRAFACVALGLLGEDSDLPWNTRLSAGSNYRAAGYALREVMDIL